MRDPARRQLPKSKIVAQYPQSRWRMNANSVCYLLNGHTSIFVHNSFYGSNCRRGRRRSCFGFTPVFGNSRISTFEISDPPKYSWSWCRSPQGLCLQYFIDFGCILSNCCANLYLGSNFSKEQSDFFLWNFVQCHFHADFRKLPRKSKKRYRVDIFDHWCRRR